MSGPSYAPNPIPDWLSIPEVAARLGFSEKTVRRLITAGDIPAERFGKRLIRVEAASLRGTPIGGARQRPGSRQRDAWAAPLGGASH